MEAQKQSKAQTKHWYKKWWGVLLIILSIPTLTFMIPAIVILWQSKNKQLNLVAKIFTGLIVAAFVLGVTASNTPSSDQVNNKPKQAKPDPAVQADLEKQAEAKKRQATIDQFAPPYCQSHQDLVINEPTLNQQGWPHTDNTRGLTNEECVAIIGKLYDHGTQAQYLKSISEDKVAIGMSKLEVVYAWGSPGDINTTLVAGSRSEQWVYGSPIYGGNYVYIDNDIVTSIQGH